jgi:formylglycine-generating enzyme required for sulfatase activity
MIGKSVEFGAADGLLSVTKPVVVGLALGSLFGLLGCFGKEALTSGDCGESLDACCKLVWTLIEGGTFTMGCSPDDDDECFQFSDETPVIDVEVGSFFMLTSEVTELQYECVTGENPSIVCVSEDAPVEGVDWFGASAFCDTIGARLPSEEEWEFAARAGTTDRFGCGEGASEDCLKAMAVFDVEGKEEVGSKLPNGFGLHDMLGNVWEWTSDFYCLYTKRGTQACEDSARYTRDGTVLGHVRVLRGGSFKNSSEDGGYTSGIPRVSIRRGVNDTLRTPDVGFRCVR